MTRFDLLLKRVLAAWTSHRTRRKLYRAMPEFRYLDEAERDAKRRHGRVNDIREAKATLMLQVLRDGVDKHEIGGAL